MLVAEQSLDFMPKVFHSSVIPSYKVLFCQNRSKNEKANDKSCLSLWGDLCTFHQVKCQCYNDFIYQPLNEIASSVFVTVSSTDNKSMLFLWVCERERESLFLELFYILHILTLSAWISIGYLHEICEVNVRLFLLLISDCNGFLEVSQKPATLMIWFIRWMWVVHFVGA